MSFFWLNAVMFGLYPLLFLFSFNAEQLEFVELLLPAILVVLLVTILVLVFSKLFKDREKGSLFSGLLVFFLLVYGHISSPMMMNDFFVKNHIGPGKVLIPLYGLFFCSLFYYLRFKAKSVTNIVKFANFFSTVLVVMSLIGIISKKSPAVLIDQTSQTQKDDVSSVVAKAGSPNVYHLIMDAYASADAIKETYNHDISDFMNFLDQEGFYTAKDSKSNYPMTTLSVSSLMNLEYVNYLSDELKKGKTYPDLLIRKKIKTHEVGKVFKDLGYKYIHFDSGMKGFTSDSTLSDVHYSCGTMSEYTVLLIRSSIFEILERRFHFLKGKMRSHILCMFENLANISKKHEGPFYVFAHFMSPHPPYVFGPNGEEKPESSLHFKGHGWLDKEGYLGQMTYVNKRLKKLIKEIKASNKVPPIILIHGDHGTALSQNWNNPDGAFLRERFSILNTILVPEDKRSKLYPSISPVNNFRYIFSEVFGKKMPLLPDRSYFSNLNGNHYDFKDVTKGL